jgi:hypothetical protein
MARDVAGCRINCFTPTYASRANPIEAHFGAVAAVHRRQLHHPNHTAQTSALHAYLRWRNANAVTLMSSLPASRTCPHPQREGHPLGRTPPRHHGLKNLANPIRSQN